MNYRSIFPEGMYKLVTVFSMNYLPLCLLKPRKTGFMFQGTFFLLCPTIFSKQTSKVYADYKSTSAEMHAIVWSQNLLLAHINRN